MILTKIRYGTAAPNDAVGADGDLFLDTTTGTWYIRSVGVYQTLDFSNSANISVTGSDLYLYYNY